MYTYASRKIHWNQKVGKRCLVLFCVLYDATHSNIAIYELFMLQYTCKINIQWVEILYLKVY